MQISYKDGTSEKKFIVVPTPDKRIIEQFIDYETGYLIIEELNEIDPSDTSIHCTIIDPENGQIIDKETRLKQVDSVEKVVVNEELGLKIISQRKVNPRTGSEIIHEKLIDMSNQRVIRMGQSVAFSKTRPKTILDIYLEDQEQKKDSERFWGQEYPQLSPGEKKAYWIRNIYGTMRMQTEIGYDGYAIFSEDNYREWRAKEPEIDAILEDVIKMLATLEMLDEEMIKEKVYQLLGKVQK